MASTNAAYTVSYSEDAKGWPSFYSYIPDYMVGMNGFFYSWNKGNLYRHNTNETRNNYYGVQYNSEITSVFNVEPQTIKLFKTMSYESDDRWACTSLFSDLGTGSMLSSYFVQKEGEWFTFLRENEGTVNWKSRSANGVGSTTNVLGPITDTVIEFPINIGSILSVGDTMYWQSTSTPVPPLTVNPILLGGVVTAVVNNSSTSVAGVVTPSSMTVDCSTGIVPAIGDFIFFIKNAVAESHGARGYHLTFTLENTNTNAVELFSVGSSIMKSYP